MAYGLKAYSCHPLKIEPILMELVPMYDQRDDNS